MTAGTDSGAEELLEPLDADACARLVAATEYGRLAVVESGRPRLVVLNHVVVGPDLLFRTSEDALIARLTAHGEPVPAAFEVDSAFPVGRSGWSVIANGQLQRESDPDHVATVRSTITAWARGDRDVVLRLAVEELTGRRVGPL